MLGLLPDEGFLERKDARNVIVGSTEDHAEKPIPKDHMTTKSVVSMVNSSPGLALGKLLPILGQCK